MRQGQGQRTVGMRIRRQAGKRCPHRCDSRPCAYWLRATLIGSEHPKACQQQQDGGDGHGLVSQVVRPPGL
jgi:hypothetical protein